MHVEFRRPDHSCDCLFEIKSVHTAAFAVQGVISLFARDDLGDNCVGDTSDLIEKVLQLLFVRW